LLIKPEFIGANHAEHAMVGDYELLVFDLPAGEAVVLGVDGIYFNALHSGKNNEEVQLYAFDILALDGDDLRHLPLSMRKTNLARLLARRPDGIFVAPFEAGEIGPDLFRAACNMGLDGSGDILSRFSDRRGGEMTRPRRYPKSLAAKCCSARRLRRRRAAATQIPFSSRDHCSQTIHRALHQ
jgi:hypothetical protein